jgi:hypothetical protein
MAKPRAKAPTKSVIVYCHKCRQKLLQYKKGGTGTLVKCFIERISKNYTEQLGVCPNCESPFGRETMIRGVPAIKIIGGKVLVK